MSYLEVIKDHQTYWKLENKQIKITHIFLTITQNNVSIFLDFLRYGYNDLEFVAVISKEMHISSKDLKYIKWANLNHPGVQCIFLRENCSTPGIFKTFINKLIKSYKAKPAVLSSGEWCHILSAFGIINFQADKIDFIDAINGSLYEYSEELSLYSLNLKNPIPVSASLRDVTIEIKKVIDRLDISSDRILHFDLQYVDDLNLELLDRITIWEIFTILSSYPVTFFWFPEGVTLNESAYISILEVDMRDIDINLYNVKDGSYIYFEKLQDSMILGKHLTFMYESCMNQDFLKVVCLIQKLSHLNFNKGRLISSWFIPEDILAHIEFAIPTFITRCNKMGINIVRKLSLNTNTSFSSLWKTPKNMTVDLFWLSSVQLALNWLSSDEQSLNHLISHLPSSQEIHTTYDLIMRPNQMLELTLAERYNKRWHAVSISNIQRTLIERDTPYHLSKQDKIMISGEKLSFKLLPPFGRLPIKTPALILKRKITSVDLAIALSSVKIVIAGQYDIDMYQNLVVRGILPLQYNLSKLNFDSNEICHMELVLDSITSFNGKVRLRIILKDGKCTSIYPKLFFLSYKHFQCFMR